MTAAPPTAIGAVHLHINVEDRDIVQLYPQDISLLTMFLMGLGDIKQHVRLSPNEHSEVICDMVSGHHHLFGKGGQHSPYGPRASTTRR